MRWLRQALMVLFIIGIVFVHTLVALAETGEVGYNIQAILPKNQHDKNNSFFDLRMIPGQEQTIEFVINNTSNKEAVFSININQAYTNNQGFIDYGDKNIKPNDTVKYHLADLISVDEEAIVPANSNKKIPIHIQMPKEEYDGQILGGIQVIKQEQNASKQKDKISNVYGYVLGLKLTETDREVKRELNLIEVKPAVSFGKTSVVSVLQNPTMDAYGHLKYHGSVSNKKDNQVIKKIDLDNNMQIAPNTNYNFSIDWGGKELIAGDYVLDLTVSDAKNNIWNFTEEFTITSKEAKEINEVTIGQSIDKQLPLWIYIVAGIIFGMIILGSVWLFVKKKSH